jgi:hypothetical protein
MLSNGDHKEMTVIWSLLSAVFLFVPHEVFVSLGAYVLKGLH